MQSKNDKIKYIIYARETRSEDEKKDLDEAIDSQLKQIRAIATEKNLTVVEEITEIQSIEEPSRPGFDKMVDLINKGEAKGILCITPGTLSGDPVYGGLIVWMLQKGLIEKIITANYEYGLENDMLMLHISFSADLQYAPRDAKKYINVNRDAVLGVMSRHEKKMRDEISEMMTDCCFWHKPLYGYEQRQRHN